MMNNNNNNNVFCPVAVETLGALADDALDFLAEIGRRATLCRAVGNHILGPAYFSGDSAVLTPCALPTCRNSQCS